MTRLAKLLDRGVVKSALSFGGGHGWSGVNAFATAYDSVWSSLGSGDKERIGASFESYVTSAYQSNGIVFASCLARAMPFSEARLAFQRLERGRPTDLFGASELSLLETPWPNGTTGELLWRMIQDADMAGNAFLTVTNGRVRRLRPDWVTIVSGVRGDPTAGPYDIDAEVLGYIYEPKGAGRAYEPVLLSPSAVAHFSPIPDPLAQWRGMSWLTPVLREIAADTAATKHKLKFFENGAQPGLVIKYDGGKTADDIKRYKAVFDEAHRGTDNAYGVLHLGGGADTDVFGLDFKQLDFKATQGAGETRIAAAAGVGAIIARFSEGMAGSSLNQGNYQAAMRQFSDLTLRPLWRQAAACLAKLITVPAGTRLWYDVRDVALLAESAKDEAEILSADATAVRTLIDAGFDPDSVIRAVDGKDISLLTGSHSGLYSVQLQRPGATSPQTGATP